MLSKQNPHPRDAQISFQEEGHIYKITGMEGKPTSATETIHHWFEEFDADRIIQKMRAGRNWKLSKYYGMTDEAIKELWDKNGQEARELGTAMHYQIECFFNGDLEETPQTKEFSQFLTFWKDLSAQYPGMKPYRTEWIIYDEGVMIAGSIDFVLANEKGELILLDWKRSKEIKRENQWQKGKGPFRHLDDCNYHHYSLQLNLYRHILETKYGKTVIGMYLVVFHPERDVYEFVRVPDRKTEILELWRIVAERNGKVATSI